MLLLLRINCVLNHIGGNGKIDRLPLDWKGKAVLATDTLKVLRLVHTQVFLLMII